MVRTMSERRATYDTLPARKDAAGRPCGQDPGNVPGHAGAPAASDGSGFLPGEMQERERERVVDALQATVSDLALELERVKAENASLRRRLADLARLAALPLEGFTSRLTAPVAPPGAIGAVFGKGEDY
jgi:hypothetical protein